MTTQPGGRNYKMWVSSVGDGYWDRKTDERMVLVKANRTQHHPREMTLAIPVEEAPRVGDIIYVSIAWGYQST